eukprot:TRINITY_DN47272_c0_g1_i1.p1 TRINITY_DN47272_c0_g1~~TRINITY_DN47272_c0_g1_i1.p1  ORF type:complete len:108 (+),score=14.20 TRINITY_DN47272_c0_g1_i1:49-324(+)
MLRSLVGSEMCIRDRQRLITNFVQYAGTIWLNLVCQGWELNVHVLTRKSLPPSQRPPPPTYQFSKVVMEAPTLKAVYCSLTHSLTHSTLYF